MLFQGNSHGFILARQGMKQTADMALQLGKLPDHLGSEVCFTQVARSRSKHRLCADQGRNSLSQRWAFSAMLPPPRIQRI